MNDPQADGPADPDPARLIPPADPWLTEAPTSAFGETPLANTKVLHEPPRRRDRRAVRWVVAVLAACALFIAGMLAIDRFSGDEDGGGGNGSDALGSGPSTQVSTAPSTAAPTKSRPAKDAGVAPVTSEPGVVYEVTASGSRNTGSVEYTDQDGEIIRLSGIPLPWRITFPVGPERKPLVLIAQRKGGGNAGPVTCTITVNGKLVASTTQHGKYAAPQCSGSG